MIEQRNQSPLAAIVLAMVFFCPTSGAALAATWTRATKPAPGGGGTMLLLTDGTVMIQNGSTAQWLRLTPDAKGSYIDGTWTSNPINPMSTNRLYYASQVLQNGRVWILGGEDYGPDTDPVFASTGEQWDPIANTWSPIAAFPPQNCFAVTYNVTGNLTSGSPAITNLPTAVTPTFLPGWAVSGQGIPANTTVASVDSTTQVHISNDATATEAGAALAFKGTPLSCFGDVPSILLPGGRILTGSLVGNSTYIYDIAGNSFSFAANKVYNDLSEEEGWTKLADGRIITYDVNYSVAAGAGYAELYDPTANRWSSISPADGSARGTLPLLSNAALFNELGPGLRLLDGRVFLIGANGLTALYTPSTNTWAAGPDIQGVLNGNPAVFGADDAPGAVLPNGHVLFAADAGPSPVISTGNSSKGSKIITSIGSTANIQAGWAVTQTAGSPAIPAGAYVKSVDSPTQVTINKSATKTANGIDLEFGGTFSPPTQLFDFDPAAGTISSLSPPIPDTRLQNFPSFITRMLMLPTGQLLFADGSPHLWIYTPDGAADPVFQPVTLNVTYSGGGVFLLTGLRLSGQSAGAAYGDDVQTDENYPIVRLVDSSGNVYYCRTTNWSSVSVGDHAVPETVNFTLNPAVTPGDYFLIVSAAGISSAPTPITIKSGEVNGR